MDTQTPDSDEDDAVRSVRLDELWTDRTPWWRAMPRTRITVSAVSLLALMAAAGSAIHYIGSGPEESAILSIEEPSPIYTGSVPAGAATEGSDSGEAPRPPEPLFTARLPKPRPPAPAMAVAASHPGYDRRSTHAYQREPDPCSALQAMSAYLPFQIYCVSERRASPVSPGYRHHPAYGRW